MYWILTTDEDGYQAGMHEIVTTKPEDFARGFETLAEAKAELTSEIDDHIRWLRLRRKQIMALRRNDIPDA